MAYTLRDLPLPVKVVASVFLMAVGAGYTAALVQLHVQDAKSGKPMPTVADVVLKFTGKKRYDPNDPTLRAKSRLEALVTAEIIDVNGQSMSGAFTTHDRATGDLKFSKVIKGKTPEQVEAIKAERKGEQRAIALWANTPEIERKTAYAADKFVPPAGQMPKAITPAHKDGDAIKIKSIIDARCVSCHSKGGEKEDVPLDTYEGIAKFMQVEEPKVVNGWVKVEEPISISKLTQSTHAHLLSFAMLFSLTGVIFAFSSYPTGLRCVLGPWVVLAVFADVSLWWLARMCDEWGPYFAEAIIATGAIAGAGLFGQIVLSLFNMYGPKGKVVVAGLLVAAGVIAGLVWVNKIDPALAAKANPQPQPDVKGPEPKKDGKGGDKKDDKKDNGAKIDGKNGKEPPKSEPSQMERLLAFPVKGPDGKALALDETPFTGGDDGNMARAFFDKDKHFKNVMEDAGKPQGEKDQLLTERDGERLALVAWVRSAEPARKAAYDADAFPLPAELAGRAITAKYLKDGKVPVKTLVADRCLKCHGEGGKQHEEYPLDTFADLKKYIDPPATPAANGNGAAAPAPAPVKAGDPPPPAKDD